MAEFVLVTHATRSPTWCVMCTSHMGPFIDTKVEEMQVATDDGIRVYEASVYLCLGCVRQMAYLAGLPPVEEIDRLRVEVEARAEHEEQLEAALQAERDNKVVTQEGFSSWLQNEIEQASATSVKRKPGRPRKIAE